MKHDNDTSFHFGPNIREFIPCNINPFHAIGLFLYSLKTENHILSDGFRGYRKGPLAWNWLMPSSSKHRKNKKIAIKIGIFYNTVIHFSLDRVPMPPQISSNSYFPQPNSSDLLEKVYLLSKSPEISSKKFPKVKFFFFITNHPLSKTCSNQYYYQSMLSCLR